ncbi:MAG TPA: FAD-dependent oxidoreductase [Solirubrobacteraceae bacterium]|nr:FAD-dependent oxidoreductase [Solirubrobacteraceae bacterium]
MADRHVAYVLIGGGLAAGNCARWLRESGADGEILLIGRESDLPYNRPDCSKGYLQGKASREDTLFRPADWYGEQQVEALTRVSVKGLDLTERSVELTDGQEVSFDKALIATGAGVRRLSVPGAELEGIHYLRTLGNSDTIRDDASGKRVVLIGGSYIATEVAASLTERGSSCSLVMLEPVALSRHFGEQAGRFFQSRLEEHGIELHGDDELDRFEGSGGRVTRVVTKGGRELEADAVVIGVGAVPDVRLARTAGLEIGDGGGVLVDAHLQTAVPGIFAAGDIAEYESVVHGGRRLRVEHWDVAFNQGKTAALNMLDRDQPHDVVPYFFSDLSDWASLEYIGPAYEWEQEVVRGSIDGGEFTIFYLHDGRVAGALAVGRSDDLDHARRLLTDGTDVAGRVAELQDVSSDLGSI